MGQSMKTGQAAMPVRRMCHQTQNFALIVEKNSMNKD